MLGPVIDHLWQSTLLVLLAGAMTVLLRRHGARWRYWIWFAASMKFLLPFALLTALGAQFAWRTLPPAPAAATAVLFPAGEVQTEPGSLASELLGQVGPADTAPAPAPERATPAAFPAQSGSDSGAGAWAVPWTAVLGAVWLLGSGLLVLRWARRWRRLRAMVRAARPLGLECATPGLADVRACPSTMEPGIFGVVRPVLLIPDGIVERLTAAQLEAIVQHERVHVERRDNLTATLHMLVEALFWFHPFVWWLGARLVDEREQACDEAVLAQGTVPEVYASGLIEVCDYYRQSPLLCAAGVGGGSLEGRVRRIADNAPVPALGRLAGAALIAAGALVCALPLTIGLLSPAAVRAQQAPVTAGLLQCLDPHVLNSLVASGVASRETIYTAERPEQMAGITPPAAFEWIGSLRRQGSDAAVLNEVTAAFRTDLESDEAHRLALAALEAGGWVLREPAGLSLGGSAFVGAMFPQPSLLCRDETAVNLNVNELDETTYVTYVLPMNQDNYQCRPEPRDPFVAGGDMEPYLPRLQFPPDPVTGEPPRPGGGGMSSTSGSQQSRTQVRHNGSLDQLAADLGRQLTEQGWATDASWIGASTAGSAWTRPTDSGTRLQGTLDLTQTGDARYTVMFRVVRLN